jgi:AraC-like DNA-binding protein
MKRPDARNTAAPLAASVGAYAEFAVAPSLQAHFRCLWFHRMPDHEVSPICVVPDGCVDLLWTGDTLRVAGPDRTAMIETMAPGATVVGLRFRPAAAVSWLRSPMSELVNRRVDLEELWGRDARGLAGWLGEAGTPGEVARRLQAGLTPLTKTIDPPDPRMAALFAMSTRVDVKRMADRLGIGERTLRRHCQHAFGYGPKTLERILRFQRFLALRRQPARLGRPGRLEPRAQPDGSGLASCAAAAGYADQAHLSREVRDLCGLSPSMILNQHAV